MVRVFQIRSLRHEYMGQSYIHFGPAIFIALLIFDKVNQSLTLRGGKKKKKKKKT